jgi:hypothetical protein
VIEGEDREDAVGGGALLQTAKGAQTQHR